MRIIKNPKIKIYDDRGKHCFIGKIGKDTYRIFDVIDADELTEEWMDKNFHWGDYPSENKPYHGWVGLKEATVIQNICWYHGLAPRVYEIVGIEYDGNKYFAQRIQDVDNLPFKETHQDAQPVYDKVINLGKIYGFHTEKCDVSKKDVKGDLLLDFNTFHFGDDREDGREVHLKYILPIIYNKARYGKIYYQKEPLLDMNGGPRNTEQRIKQMDLASIDFKNKIVLDLGCAGGAFCRYAKDRGAKKVLGIDFEDVIGSDTRLAAYLISWELGYFDIDFEQHDLREYKPKTAQVVFFLSLNYHIDIPKWLPEITNEVCIFEDNSKGRIAEPILNQMFKKVEFKGYTNDHGGGLKSIFFCYK